MCQCIAFKHVFSQSVKDDKVHYYYIQVFWENVIKVYFENDITWTMFLLLKITKHGSTYVSQEIWLDLDE